MYKIIDDSERMSPEQIMSAFKGKWVFLVDLKGSPFGWFESAIPAIVADEPFEGDETGIYDKLENEYNGNTTTWSFLPYEINVFGFTEVLLDGN